MQGWRRHSDVAGGFEAEADSDATPSLHERGRGGHAVALAAPDDAAANESDGWVEDEAYITDSNASHYSQLDSQASARAM